MKRIAKNRKTATLFSFLLFSVLLLLLACQKENGKPIKVGILHSLTGTMAVSEKPAEQIRDYSYRYKPAADGRLRFFQKHNESAPRSRKPFYLHS